MTEIETDIQERLKRLHKGLADANERIKKAEDVLKTIPCRRSVTFCFIKWDAEMSRITFEGKPLYECKANVRLSNFREVDGLIDKVLAESEEMMGAS